MDKEVDVEGTLEELEDSSYEFTVMDPVTGKSLKRAIDKGYFIKMFFQKEVYIRYLTLKVESDLDGFEKYKKATSKKVMDKIMSDTKKNKFQKMNWLKGMERYSKMTDLPKELSTAIDYIATLLSWRQEMLDMIQKDRPERYTYLFDNYNLYYEESLAKFTESGKDKFLKGLEGNPIEDTQEVNS